MIKYCIPSNEYEKLIDELQEKLDEITLRQVKNIIYKHTVECV